MRRFAIQLVGFVIVDATPDLYSPLDQQTMTTFRGPMPSESATPPFVVESVSRTPESAMIVEINIHTNAKQNMEVSHLAGSRDARD